MNKQLSLVVLIAGLALIIYGIGASNSFTSNISKNLAQSSAERAIVLLYGGAVFVLLGGYGMMRRAH